MGVPTDLKARGMQDILITSADNLNGYADVIRTVFPQSSTQICVEYQIGTPVNMPFIRTNKSL